MNVHGTFLVCGGEVRPAIHFLTPAEMRALYQRDALAGDSDKGRQIIMRAQFGMDARYALPCWSAECMAAIALGYTGPHEAQVRGMAAAWPQAGACRPATRQALVLPSRPSLPTRHRGPACQAPSYQPRTGWTGRRFLRQPVGAYDNAS